MNKEMTVKERLELARENTKLDVNRVEQDLYSFIFNHPYYIEVTRSDDEERHVLLDELDIPRTLEK